MNALIVHPNKNDEKLTLLSRLLERLEYTIAYVSGVEDIDKSPMLASGSTLVIIPELHPQAVSPRQVAALAERLNSHFFVYVSDDISSDDYKALIRSGSAEWVGWKSAVSELVEISRRRNISASTKPAASASGPPHTVTTFLSSGGGCGNTTLALETGILLSAGKGRDKPRVALVDLNFQRSVVCDYVDVQPRLDLSELLHNPERLDDYLLDIFTTKHSTGLDIFAAASSNIDLASISPTVVFALLDQLFDRYQSVLLDVPAQWLPWTGPIVANSDMVVITGRYTVPAIKQITFNLKVLADLKVAATRTLVALNHCEKKLIGGVVRHSDMDAALGGVDVEYIQSDPGFASECVNTGKSMVQLNPVRGVCRDIKRLSGRVKDVKPRIATGVASAK